MDPDIPIAYAAPAQGVAVTPMVPPSAPPARGLQRGGGSSRVMMPRGKSQRTLSSHEQKTLEDQGFTKGLIQSMIKNHDSFPLRIWIVDNSGSMSTGDGNRIIPTKSNTDVKLVKCSRWTELVETVEYHCQISALFELPTVFRLLNDPGVSGGHQQFSIAERGSEHVPEDLRIAQQTLRETSPSGVTPLSQHILEIRANVMQLRDDLVSTGRKVVIVIATDGLPTDPYGYSNDASRREFQDSLRSLEGLPVWIVIRLCTDEDDVVDYYNNLDAQLELSLEVLDDFMSEAKEVTEHNPFINYTLPLHRIREMGFKHRLFDLLDERALSMDELRDFMILLFGQDQFDGVPDPQVDFEGFLERISVMVHKENKQWNPIKKRWITGLI